MKRGMENDNNNNNGTKKLKKPSVAFKGMRNNFTEAAAIQHFEMTEKVEVETSPCNSFQEVFHFITHYCSWDDFLKRINLFIRTRIYK